MSIVMELQPSVNTPTVVGVYWVRELDGTRTRTLRVQKRPDGMLAIGSGAFWVPVTHGFYWGDKIELPSGWSLD